MTMLPSLPDELVARIGACLVDVRDRNNMRLASKRFNAAHWDRLCHRINLTRDDGMAALRLSAVRTIKPCLQNIAVKLSLSPVLDATLDVIVQHIAQSRYQNVHIGVRNLATALGFLRKVRPGHRPQKIAIKAPLIGQHPSLVDVAQEDVARAVLDIRAARERNPRVHLAFEIASGVGFMRPARHYPDLLAEADEITVFLCGEPFVDLSKLDMSKTSVTLYISRVTTFLFNVDIVGRASRICLDTATPLRIDALLAVADAKRLRVINIQHRGLFESYHVAAAAIKNMHLDYVLVARHALTSVAVVPFVRALVAPPNPVREVVLSSDSPASDCYVRIIAMHAKQVSSVHGATKVMVHLADPWTRGPAALPEWSALSRLF